MRASLGEQHGGEAAGDSTDTVLQGGALLGSSVGEGSLAHATVVGHVARLALAEVVGEEVEEEVEEEEEEVEEALTVVGLVQE